MPGPTDAWSLRESRDWLRARVYDGERCPCCSQLAKVYRRTITSRMAVALFVVHRTIGFDYAHWPTLLLANPITRAQHGGDEAKLTHWGLIEDAGEVRDDGGRAGWWRVTQLGADWLANRVTVPKHALIFDGRCLGLEGPPTRLVDALGTKFNLRELMSNAN